MHLYLSLYLYLCSSLSDLNAFRLPLLLVRLRFTHWSRFVTFLLSMIPIPSSLETCVGSFVTWKNVGIPIQSSLMRFDCFVSDASMLSNFIAPTADLQNVGYDLNFYKYLGRWYWNLGTSRLCCFPVCWAAGPSLNAIHRCLCLFFLLSSRYRYTHNKGVLYLSSF